MQETALAADMPKHLVSVKWDKPGSRFDGVVHSVPFELVDYTEEKRQGDCVVAKAYRREEVG